MPDAMYTRARQKFLGGELDWDTNTFKARLIDTGTYVFSAAHTSVNDLSGIVHTSAALTGTTKVDGYADCADITFTAAAGVNAEAIVIYHEDASSASSTLVVYIDSAAQFPVTPNGGDIVAVINASGLFRI